MLGSVVNFKSIFFCLHKKSSQWPPQGAGEHREWLWKSQLNSLYLGFL